MIIFNMSSSARIVWLGSTPSIFPRYIIWKYKNVQTASFKSPVSNFSKKKGFPGLVKTTKQSFLNA